VRPASSAALAISPETMVIGPEGVQLQLGRILASRFFSHSGRLHRFLSFAAKHALARSGERLKEYLVGVEVYDRGPDYDPRIDPIVRVEARRLRAKLKAYYASIGRNDPLLIELPKGTYTPRFRARTNYSRKPRSLVEKIAVLPFVTVGGLVEQYFLSQGLTDEVIHQLMRVPNLSVVAWPSGMLMPPFDGQLWSRSRLELRGSIRLDQGNSKIGVQLIDRRSGAYMWSETYEAPLGDILSVHEGIAQAIVAKVQTTIELKSSYGAGAVISTCARMNCQSGNS